jgi:hypothetical protein
MHGEALQFEQFEEVLFVHTLRFAVHVGLPVTVDVLPARTRGTATAH